MQPSRANAHSVLNNDYHNNTTAEISATPKTSPKVTGIFGMCLKKIGPISANIFTVGQKIRKESRPKKLVKSNTYVNQFREFCFTKIHFLQFQKWSKINF